MEGIQVAIEEVRFYGGSEHLHRKAIACPNDLCSQQDDLHEKGHETAKRGSNQNAREHSTTHHWPHLVLRVWVRRGRRPYEQMQPPACTCSGQQRLSMLE